MVHGVQGVGGLQYADLNKNEFPLHTTTYPITRGMRAELACTIIICILGVISQIKFWKMLKERKAKKEQLRLDDQARRDERDSWHGKIVENRNTRSLAAWEAVYGDNNGKFSDETPLDSLKKSASVSEREIETIEMEDLDASSKQSKKYTTTHAADGVPSRSALAGPATLGLEYAYSDFSWPGEFKASKSDIERSIDRVDPVEPIVPALPFSTLVEQDRAKGYDESREIEALPSRYSGDLHNGSERASFEIELLEDDRASSIAATMDEAPDMDALSTKRLSFATTVHTARDLAVSFEAFKAQSGPSTPGEQPLEVNDNEELVQQPTSERSKNEGSSEQKEEVPPVPELKDGILPNAISKVAHVYRTNEWAKHVADADKPETVDESLNPEEPAVHVDVGRTEEAPRPVDARALSPEELQPQFFRKVSNPYRKNSQEALRRQSNGTPVYSFQRQTSNSSLHDSKQPNRRTSKLPTQQPLVESPSEDRLQVPANLMDERNLRVQSGPTTVNFNALMPPSSSNPTSQSASTPPVEGSEPVTDADTTFAQRKSLLAQGRITPEPRQLHSAQGHRPSTARVASPSNQGLIYDSHQPKRHSSLTPIKQNAMLTQWRQSLQQEHHYGRPDVYAGQRQRQSMLDYHRLKDHQEQKEQAERKQKEKIMERAMRTPDFSEKHRDAMRKMQAQAHESKK